MSGHWQLAPCSCSSTPPLYRLAKVNILLFIWSKPSRLLPVFHYALPMFHYALPMFHHALPMFHYTLPMFHYVMFRILTPMTMADAESLWLRLKTSLCPADDLRHLSSLCRYESRHHGNRLCTGREAMITGGVVAQPRTNRSSHHWNCDPKPDVNWLDMLSWRRMTILVVAAVLVSSRFCSFLPTLFVLFTNLSSCKR